MGLFTASSNIKTMGFDKPELNRLSYEELKTAQSLHERRASVMGTAMQGAAFVAGIAMMVASGPIGLAATVVSFGMIGLSYMAQSKNERQINKMAEVSTEMGRREGPNAINASPATFTANTTKTMGTSEPDLNRLSFAELETYQAHHKKRASVFGTATQAAALVAGIAMVLSSGPAGLAATAVGFGMFGLSFLAQSKNEKEAKKMSRVSTEMGRREVTEASPTPFKM